MGQHMWGKRHKYNIGKRKNGIELVASITCWYCKKPLGKRFRLWKDYPVHEKCYKPCCVKFRKTESSVQPSPEKKGIIAELFSWVKSCIA